MRIAPARTSGIWRIGVSVAIHRKKPKGKPMVRNVARANAKRPRIRAAVEHVFADQKLAAPPTGPRGLLVHDGSGFRRDGRLWRGRLVFKC